MIGKHLDLDDVAATSELAAQELADLRSENKRLREEVMSLRMTAAQRDKLARLGGAAWVLQNIDRAKYPA